jgi:hypothetical protein
MMRKRTGYVFMELLTCCLTEALINALIDGLAADRVAALRETLIDSRRDPIAAQLDALPAFLPEFCLPFSLLL